ncbi:MAG: response regulator transcription factor [Bdellovibrionales bacterium]
MNILLAEDDHNIATIALMALETLGGHTVTHADNGEKAYNLAKENTYDVILLDEMMPKMNGLKVCKTLLTEGFRTPIIFLSAKSQSTDISLFESLGTGFIPKPFDPSTLCSEIEKILKEAA